MELEVTNFIKEKIKFDKVNLKVLIDLVSAKFKCDLIASDVSFIFEQYRSTLMKLWRDEFIDIFNEKSKQKVIADEEILEVLGIFRGLKAFENTPEKLQGEFYKKIRDERKIFISQDFVQSRTDIFNFLTNKTLLLSEQIKNENKFLTYLMEVLRNSYLDFGNVVEGWNLRKFIAQNISLYQVSRAVLTKSFNIQGYDTLKDLSAKIDNKKSLMDHLIRKELSAFLEHITIEESEENGKRTMLLQRKLITSKDLTIGINSNIHEIHIVCDILHIDRDLSENYRGKNVFVASNTIHVHKKSIWNLSGWNSDQKFTSDAGQFSNGDGKNGEDGKAGESGGNCEIFSMTIQNGNLWTIQSNGGDGVDGQDGGNGQNGLNGRDIQEKDFTLNNKKFSMANFHELLNEFGISTDLGSRRCKFFESKLEKEIVFNRSVSKSELIMLIKGTAGTLGALGGFGGFGGRGGFAGKININCNDSNININENIGKDGQHGNNGFNGQTGQDGGDACMKIEDNEYEPEFGGLNEKLKFEISFQNRKTKFSIFYKPLERTLYLIQLENAKETTELERNTPEEHGPKLAANEKHFYETLMFVVKNASRELKPFINKLKIQMFIDKKITVKELIDGIIANEFNIQNYDILKNIAKLFTVREMQIEQQIYNFIQNYFDLLTITKKSEGVYELKKKLMTSDELNQITEDFNELQVICDTLYIHSNLSNKFRGRNLIILSNTITVSKNVVWNLSGSDNFLALKENCREIKYFINGGHCIIDCNIIHNTSLFKVISNGGNASNARDGIDAEMKDFTLKKKSIEKFPNITKEIIQEGAMIKYLVKESNSNYLLIVKGQDAVMAYNGVGEQGGFPGSVQINADENTNDNEIEIICENGRNDSSRDGRDAFLYVRNGKKEYFGLDTRKKYDLISSETPCEYSIEHFSKHYFPKFSRNLDEETGSQSLALYRNIIWVLRNSYNSFDHIVRTLDLEKFVNYEITLLEVARKIKPSSSRTNWCENIAETTTSDNLTLNNNLNIANYIKLENCALNFMHDSSNIAIRDFIRHNIEKFLEPVIVQKSADILTIKKKLYHSSSFENLTIDSSINEIRLICDTLHIDSELPQCFRSKNLAINANYVHIKKNVKWSLSGIIVHNNVQSDAGQELDGRGVDGKDGIAGKSGGNFLLNCDFIENSSALTIESNGSDGRNGQNGGNGSDGENGKDANLDSFKKNGIEWKIYLSDTERHKMYGAFELIEGMDMESTITTDDGLKAYVFKQHLSLVMVIGINIYGMILVKGNNGEQGKTGGLPGYGGQGGRAGNVEIHSQSLQNINITETISGNDGTVGRSGFNGLNGKAGRDMYKTDKLNAKEAVVNGNDKPRKYEIEWTSTSCDTCFYVYLKKKYAKPVEKNWEPQSEAQRNKSTLSRERQFEALTKKCAPIKTSEFINESSKYLSSSELNFKKSSSSNVISDRAVEIYNFKKSTASLLNENKDYLQESLHKISVEINFKISQETSQKSTKKSDILTDTSVSKYSEFLKTSNDEISNISKRYNTMQLNMEVEETEVQTQINVQTKYNPRKIEKLNASEIAERILYVNLLKKLLKGCKADELLKIIQKSQFASNNYKNLYNAYSFDKVNKTKRHFYGQNDILKDTIENFLEIHGNEFRDRELIKVRDLRLKGDSEWMNCLENSSFLKNFSNYCEDRYPAFLTNFIKNHIKDSYLEVKDLTNLCQEKFLFIFFRGIYSQMNKHVLKSKPSIMSFDTNISEFWDQINFLEDTNKFLSGSESLDKHFSENGEDEISEILDFFILNILNFEITLPESIFNILIEHDDELTSIVDILEEFSEKSLVIIESDDSDDVNIDDEIFEDEDNTEAEDLFYENLKKEKYLKMLTEFYSNETIVDFIKEDIKSQGINSILYRCILAHKYEVKITVFVRNFDEHLKIAEQHNFIDDLKFSYFSRQNEWSEFVNEDLQNVKDDFESSNELFILLNDGRFSILKFESAKYEAFKFKQLMDVQCASIVKVLNGQNVDETEKDKINEFLNPLMQKFQIKNNIFLKIFDDKKFLINNNILIDIIVSSFPLTLLKYDQNGVSKWLIDDNIEEKIAKFKHNSSGSIVQYKIQNDEEIRENIKLDLFSIASVDGLSILKAIAIRFFNDTNSQTLREFSLILKTILNLLGEHDSLKYYLTFLILSCEQNLWCLELALLKLENVYGLFDENLKKKWRKISKDVEIKKVLELFLEKVYDIDQIKDELNESGFDDIIENMQYFEADNYDNLKNSNLSSWRLMTTEKYWKKELAKLKLQKPQKTIDELKVIFEDLNNKFGTKAKVVIEILRKNRNHLLKIDLVKFLKNFNTLKWKPSDEALEILSKSAVDEWESKLEKHFSSDGSIRSVPDIINLVKIDDETSPRIKHRIEDIGGQAQEVFNIRSIEIGKEFINFDEAEIKKWIKDTKENVKKFKKPSIIESLAIITRMFQIKTNNKITLRFTQLISILTMWDSENGVLMQVSTGEGKTFIGVAFAILKVLYGEKVDVITSSSILAVRDADENKEYFSFFDISVDHNCHDNVERRKQAYGAQVVYGILGNFQRDYLLTEFFDENFLSGHHFSNVLVDEVDSMLLDKGNNILYLSSSLPDIDEIESVFVFIWQYVHQSSSNPEEAAELRNPKFARKIILDCMYGLLEKEDIEDMKANVDSDKIINEFKLAKIIDEENIICDETFSESKFDDVLQGFDAEICEKIKAFCRNKIEGEKPVKIPKYLKKFVLMHLTQWIKSAIRAMHLSNENEYVVDRPRESHKSYNDPNIIIIDLDTGTDMTNSQWDEGLHQFIQLKHGCKLSTISLKNVFISNVSYFKKFNKLYGMTGTLGSLEERKKTTKMHQIDFVTLPRYVERKFDELSTIVLKDSSLWIEKIHDETVEMFKEKRSVLIICETIEQTKIIRKTLLQNSSTFSNENVLSYQRDATEFSIKILEPKYVIIATNLAGRGTDIKLSKHLKTAGGLHVILTYLPQNARIENQAFGRSSRAGDTGSGRLIIHVDPIETITKMKEKRNHNELQRLDEVNNYYQNFIKIEEEFFSKFHTAFRELKQAGDKMGVIETTLTITKTLVNQMMGQSTSKKSTQNVLSDDFIKGYKGFEDARGTDAIKIYLDNFKLQWSFWLDENSQRLEQESGEKNELQNSFKQFISNAPKIHPVMRTELFKSHNNNDFEKAKGVLMDDFHSDSVTYQYLKCYEIIKRKQIANDYLVRNLDDEERNELVKCLRMLQRRIHTRNARAEIINKMKEMYQISIVPIKAFENQQKTMNEIDDIYVDSIHCLLGKAVTPETLLTVETKNDYLTKDLYEELLTQKAISYPKISKYYIDDDVKTVSRNNNISYDEMKKFIELERSNEISSIDKIGIELKKIIKPPSREEFWDIIKKKNILSNEVEYAIIDIGALTKIDPSIQEDIDTVLQNESKSTSSNEEIFFASIKELNGDQKYFNILLKDFKSKLSPARFNFLMENNAIKINKKATFNINEYNKLKYTKIFENFDGIESKDFLKICVNYNRIIEKLTTKNEQNKTVLLNRGSEYGLNYKALLKIDSDDNKNIFGNDKVYQSDVIKLLMRKFAYRIALETLANSVIENVNKGISSNNLIIHLHISPHLSIVSDLIANNILELSKANESMFENIDKVKNKFNIKNVVQEKIGNGTSSFSKQTTVDFLVLNNARMINDFDNIKKKIKECIEALSNEELEIPDIVLASLSDMVTKDEHKEMLEFMKLKGFNMVMKVELKKYSSTYWKRFSGVVAIAAGQIIIGVLIIIYSQGILYKVGEALIQEGIGDAIFALGTLRNGHFKWIDYWNHKWVSVLITLTFGFLRFSLAKTDMFAKYFKETQKVNNYLVENLKDKTSIQGLVKSDTTNATRAEVFKLFASNVGSNFWKAGLQAGIGMGADYIIEQFLDKITVELSDTIVNKLQANFYEHDISRTIDKLLKYYNANDAIKVVLEKFNKISESQRFWTDIAEKVSDKVDDLIRTGQNIAKLLTVTATIVAKLLELSSVMVFTMNIFNYLNSSLIALLNEKNIRDKVETSVSSEDAKNIKTEILQHIKMETSMKLKNAINSTAVKPALSYAANTMAEKTLSVMKQHYTAWKEKNYRKSANEIIEGAVDGKISDYNAFEVNKILGKTNDPEIYAKLTKLDIPMNSVGILAAVAVLSDKFGTDFKINVNFDGRTYIFGGKSNNSETITIDLSNGHFENSNNSSFGKNCLFDAICDQKFELRAIMSPQEFRNLAANAMLKNNDVIREIQSSKKEYFQRIGFYGGQKDNKNEQNTTMENIVQPKKKVIDNAIVPLPGKKTGSYGMLRNLVPDTYVGMFEIHHEPLYTAYDKKFLIEKGLNRYNLPCLTLPTFLHRILESTKRSSIFGTFSSACIEEKRFDLSLKLGLIDIQNAAITAFRDKKDSLKENSMNHKTSFYYNEYKIPMGFGDTQESFMNILKDQLKEHVKSLQEYKYTPSRTKKDKDGSELIETSPKSETHQFITKQQADKLIAMINKFSHDEKYSDVKLITWKNPALITESKILENKVNVESKKLKNKVNVESKKLKKKVYVRKPLAPKSRANKTPVKKIYNNQAVLGLTRKAIKEQIEKKKIKIIKSIDKI